jgi:hypothetical protein
MDIGGTKVVMDAGESYIGNFELPHRLQNKAEGTVRVHLIVDILMPLPLGKNSSISKAVVLRPTWCEWAQAYYSSWNTKDETNVPSLAESAFHFALNTANLLLEGDAAALARRTACIDAFSNYRCSRGDSVVTQSSVEKGYYSDPCLAR